jgi:hypothetical protein
VVELSAKEFAILTAECTVPNARRTTAASGRPDRDTADRRSDRALGACGALHGAPLGGDEWSTQWLTTVTRACPPELPDRVAGRRGRRAGRGLDPAERRLRAAGGPARGRGRVRHRRARRALHVVPRATRPGKVRASAALP